LSKEKGVLKPYTFTNHGLTTWTTE
jgi:hypothetical protein